MRRPSEILPGHGLRQFAGTYAAVTLLGLLVLVFGVPMQDHAQFLVNDRAPMGILSLQVTHTAEAARSILASWGREAKRHARLSLDWDMGFAVAYTLLLTMLMERVGRVAGRLGIIGAWLPIWAGSSDLVENLFHMSLVSGTAQASAADLGFLTRAAFVFATIKWVLLACWLAVFSLCLGAIVICRLRRMRYRSQAK